MRTSGLTVAALGALAVFLSACAHNSSPTVSAYGGGGATSPAASGSAGAMASQPATTMLTIKKTGIGYVLANTRGYTLYWYARDKQGSGTSACTGQCLSAWPAVTGRPAVSGIKLNGVLGTLTRPGGIVQATYNGYPLYTYADDNGPGVTAGNGAGGVWHVITGKVLTSSVPAGKSSSTSSGGRYGSPSTSASASTGSAWG